MNLPEKLLRNFHTHCIRVCVSTMAHQNEGVSQIAARVMNHSEIMAKQYQRSNEEPAIALSTFMESRVQQGSSGTVPTPFLNEMEDGEGQLFILTCTY